GSTVKGGIEVTQLNEPVHVMKVAIHLPEYIPKNIMINCVMRQLRNYATIKRQLPKGLVSQIDKYQSQLPASKKLGPLSSDQPESGPCETCLQHKHTRNPMFPAWRSSIVGTDSAPSRSGSDWEPVAFRPGAAIPPTPSDVRLLDGAKLTQKAQNWYVLETGTALLESAKLTRIDTGLGSVIAETGAAVLICSEANLTRILNLSDRTSGDVKALFGQSIVDLQPGAEASLVHAARKDAADLVMSDGMARRKVRVIELSGNEFIVKAQVSLVLALSKHPLLAMIRRSTQKGDRALVAELLKTAAGVYMTADRTGGPYAVPLAPISDTGTGTGKQR